MSDHEDKKAILTRRRRFLVAALAGAGVAAVGGCEGDEPEPDVCLSPMQPPDSGADSNLDAGDEPQVCLRIDPDALSPPDGSSE